MPPKRAARSKSAVEEESQDEQVCDVRNVRTRTHAPQELEEGAERVQSSPTPVRVPVATTTTSTPDACWLEELRIGAKAHHRLLNMQGVIIQHPAAADFLHRGKVLIRYAAVEKKQMVMRNMWCMPEEIEVVRSSPRKQIEDAAKSVETHRAVRPFQNVPFEEVEMEEAAAGRPELAAHERGRAIPERSSSSDSRPGSSTKWGVLGAHKTAPTNVSIEQRLKEFPDNSFVISASVTRGKVLFCRCCPKEVQNILGTIKTHVSSDRHKLRLKTWVQKNKGDNSITEFLHDYFNMHPNEKDSSVSEELQLYRWRVVEACLHAGVPMSKIDALRALLERSGNALTASEHLGQFIAKIEAFEYNRIKEELKGRSVCLIYDGTTRLGECTAVIMRWCSDTFEIHQRVIALRTVKRHLNGDNLGPFLIDLIAEVGVRSASIVCTARDSCATNGKAERNIAPILKNACSMMCVSHTLSHTAEHVDLPVLNEFMTSWLSLVQHHPSAKSAWKEKMGGRMKGFSNIRWFSREEVCNELAENYGALPDYMDFLQADEIGDAHPKKMSKILKEQGDTLKLELACNLDCKPLLSTCYSLEGDGLGVLLAYRKLRELMSWGDTMGDRADSMPNTAAVLRGGTTLQTGVRIYEYFADTTPPRWFKGQIVAHRQQHLFTVLYEDGTKIDQEEREVRQWIDVRDFPEWKRLAAAAKAGVTYLRNRMEGNLPAQQKNYDCSSMFQVLEAVQVFDPSWAASNLSAERVDLLSNVTPITDMVPALQCEREAYRAAASSVSIDHTENAKDHSFTDQVLKFFKDYGANFPAWTSAAKIVFAFTPNSAAAERVFSMLNDMFGDKQSECLGDYLQSAIMLRYNKREVG